MKVLEELYLWKKIKLSQENQRIYVRLRPFKSVEIGIDTYGTPDTIAPLPNEDSSFMVNYIQQDAENHKVEKEENEVSYEKRMRRNFILSIVRTLVFCILYILWIIFIYNEKNVFESCWMNQSITKKLYTDIPINSHLGTTIDALQAVSSDSSYIVLNNVSFT